MPYCEVHRSKTPQHSQQLTENGADVISLRLGKIGAISLIARGPASANFTFTKTLIAKHFVCLLKPRRSVRPHTEEYPGVAPRSLLLTSVNNRHVEEC